MSSPDPPKSRDPADDFGRGIEVYLQHLPELLEAEQGAREVYDPARIEHNLALEEAYDPQRGAIRRGMGDSIQSAVEAGYDLPDDFEREIEQDIRGGQAARGHSYGNAAISAEALTKGRFAYDMYNRNLANAGTYLSQASPSMPDRSPGYTVGGLSAGPAMAGLGQNAYQNALAGYNAQGNPWAQGLTGAASGAAVGSAFGPWGAVIGGVAGGAAGYFSDVRAKENITYTGEKTPDGIPLAEFNYKSDSQRYRGVVAQDVENIRPEAVFWRDGLRAVVYEMLGLRLEKI